MSSTKKKKSAKSPAPSEPVHENGLSGSLFVRVAASTLADLDRLTAAERARAPGHDITQSDVHRSILLAGIAARLAQLEAAA